jgi:membrane associated rhomboid family serine protease
MWFLFIFGDNIEEDFGKFYIPFYLIGGMVAGLAHIYMMPQSAEFFVGASGAISAVMGAYLVFYPHAYIASLIFLIFFVTVVNIPAWFWLLIWFFQGNVLPTLLNSMSYVAYWAHIGGFVFGVIVAFMVLPIVRRRRRSETYSTPYYW